MLVDEGLGQLLTAQLTYLGTLTWKLYLDNISITTTTVLADLTTEAGWTGYAPVPAGPWTAITIVDPRALSVDLSFPTFSNSSGSPQTFYIIALVDTSAGKLIDARNIGATTIADGSSYAFIGTISDKQE